MQSEAAGGGGDVPVVYPLRQEKGQSLMLRRREKNVEKLGGMLPTVQYSNT